MINFLDTSAILNGALYKYNNIYISPLVLTELEDIKNRDNRNNNNIKYLARKAVKEINATKNINYTLYPHKKIEKMMKRYSFLTPINDHFLLCEANILGEEKNEFVNFITSDGALYLFAQHLSHLNAIFFDANESQEENYCGWQDYTPTDLEMIELYSHPERNVLKAKTNQFLKIFEDGQIKDVLFWDGKIHRKIGYKEIVTSLGEKIKPRNLEQKMAFDLLQNKNIPVKLLIGKPGSGKDYLMVSHALEMIQRGLIDKIIFIRNLVPFKDAPEIGFLAGSIQEKISWGMGPLKSILGEEELDSLQQQGIIEAQNLGFIRGCSWNNTIIYISEGQNLTAGGYKLLVSRCGEGSQLWINGDILQTDDKKFEENNGIIRLTKSLSGNKLFGMVELIKTERSETAELAAII